MPKPRWEPHGAPPPPPLLLPQVAMSDVASAPDLTELQSKHPDLTTYLAAIQNTILSMLTKTTTLYQQQLDRHYQQEQGTKAMAPTGPIIEEVSMRVDAVGNGAQKRQVAEDGPGTQDGLPLVKVTASPDEL